MSITVRPDPDHPLGGHALLVVRGRTTQGPVSVSVLDLYEDRHLGPKGWQAAPVSLGPYAAYDEGDALVVPVGPEVVDHIEEYATLRLSVAGVSAELAWPETIRISPKRTVAPGEIDQTVPGREETKTPVQKTDPPVVKTDDEEERDRDQIIIDGEPPIRPPGPNRLPLILAALMLLALIGGGAWWYLNQPQPVVEEAAVTPPAPEPPTPAPVATPQPVVAAGCDAAGLAAAAALPAAEGFAAVAACGAQGDAEARFRIIEAAADAGIGEAIAMIGRWWDPAEAAAVGSSFTRQDPGQAARYYRDAVAAGFTEAEPLLARACAALDPDTDPTHEIARDTFCP